jgi:hypothetical protein
MVGLLDIAPQCTTIDVLGSQVEIFGLSAKHIAWLLARFPEIRMLLANRDVDADRWSELAPDAVAAIIAAGTGQPDNAEVEKVAGALPLHAQAEIIFAILKMTMPGGIGPFVERLTKAIDLGGAGSGRVPAGNSQAQ